MSDSSSIFVDSASTHLPSNLALERTIDQLNHSKLPAIFFGELHTDSGSALLIVMTRRSSLSRLKVGEMNPVSLDVTALTSRTVQRRQRGDGFFDGRHCKVR